VSNPTPLRKKLLPILNGAMIFIHALLIFGIWAAIHTTDDVNLTLSNAGVLGQPESKIMSLITSKLFFYFIVIIFSVVVTKELFIGKIWKKLLINSAFFLFLASVLVLFSLNLLRPILDAAN